MLLVAVLYAPNFPFNRNCKEQIICFTVIVSARTWSDTSSISYYYANHEYTAHAKNVCKDHILYCPPFHRCSSCVVVMVTNINIVTTPCTTSFLLAVSHWFVAVFTQRCSVHKVLWVYIPWQMHCWCCSILMESCLTPHHGEQQCAHSSGQEHKEMEHILLDWVIRSSGKTHHTTAQK